MNPNSPPPTKIANTTQKDDNPVEFPKIFGPMILPSICCNTRMNIKKYRPLIGSARAISMTLGTAPTYGPKNGMTFVTPTITATNRLYGIRMMTSPI